jgi:hypothetical protein
MNILSKPERRLRDLIEGAFGKVFPGPLHPIEIADRLLEEMEDQKLISRAKVFVPNQFTVFLHPEDLKYLEPISHEALPEMEGDISAYAQKHHYRLIGPPQVSLEPDEEVPQGELRIRSGMVPEKISESDEQTVPLGEYAVLVVVEGPEKGCHYPLDFRAEKTQEPGKIKIGRWPEKNDLLLPKSDRRASREHAWIEYDGGNGCYRLHDNHSAAGTQVNGVTLEEPIVLQNGDKIRCSETVFRLALPSLTGEERTLDV